MCVFMKCYNENPGCVVQLLVTRWSMGKVVHAVQGMAVYPVVNIKNDDTRLIVTDL